MKIIKLSFLLLFIFFFGNNIDFVSAQTIYPANIDDLKIVEVTDNTMSLTWTASGDDDYFGYADHYDMRISKAGIAPVAWNLYEQVLNLPKPGIPAVKKEQFTITGLNASTTYSVAVRAVDAAGNYSLDFNVAEGTTLSSTSSVRIINNLNFFPKLEYSNPISKLFSITIFKAGELNPVLKFSQVTDSSGKVSLPSNSGLFSGAFDILVKSDKYLSKKTRGLNLKSDMNINLEQMSAGDLNSDGIINSLDWSLLSSNWFTSNSSYDLSGDGFVNSLDWSIMSKNWFLMGDF